MGRGGVDDAEDPEAIWHEFGHAIQDDQVPNWVRRSRAAPWARLRRLHGCHHEPGDGRGHRVAPTACVMDWDATSYTVGEPHCLRRTDGDKDFTPTTWTAKSMTTARSGRTVGHQPGAGRDEATTIIVEAHSG